MRILFVDDEPENVSFVSGLLRDTLGAEVSVAESVDDAIGQLHAHTRTPISLVVMDVFVPVGETRFIQGPRARRAVEGIEHLGGLVLLDEIERLEHPPKVLVHTACNDYALVELLQEHGAWRVPKPASPDVLIRAVMEALER